MELLEREPQLEALGARLSGVRRSGVGRLLLVSGEAGAGKSALLEAFEAQHPSVPFLTGGCEALFTPRPLGPLLDVAAATGGELAEVCERGGSASEVLEALQRAVRGASVVVLEDLHWADAATLDVLRLLGRRVPRLRALVVITYRDDELERDHPLRVVLGDLKATDRIALPPLSPAAVGEELHARTGGNPFFVTELLAAGGDDVPGSVRDAVLARASRLPGVARRLLEAVAVMRPRAEMSLLERIAAEDLASLESCLTSGMLRSEGYAIAFRHEIARAAVEDALPPDRRIALHRAALGALAETGVEPARLAHHAEASGDAAAVLEHATAAGDRAARLGAHREAAAHFAAALRHSPGGSVELLERRSQACFMAGLAMQAKEARVAALEQHVAAGDRLREGDAHRWLSRLAWYLGDGKGFRTHAVKAVEILETLPPGPELAMAYAGRAQPHVCDFDLPGTLEWDEKALALAEGHGVTEVSIAATLAIGYVELSHGLTEGHERLGRGLGEALESDHPHLVGVAYSNLVSGAMFGRDRGLAESYLEPGLAYCEEHDLPAWATYLAGWSARIALDRGRWGEAQAVADGVLDRTRGRLPQSRLTALVVAGLVRARRGAEDPWSFLDEALAIAEATCELQRLGPVAAARAEARWLAGEAGRVEQEAAVALAPAERSAHAATLASLRMPPTGDGPYEAALALGTSGDEGSMRQGLAALHDLGARPAGAIVARRLRELGARGVQLGPRAQTQANPAGLTARQLDVLALLVQGDRNADIAAKLFLSEKTVGHHVSAILGKLGARTRSQAAARAAELKIGRLPEVAGPGPEEAPPHADHPGI